MPRESVREMCARIDKSGVPAARLRSVRGIEKSGVRLDQLLTRQLLYQLSYPGAMLRLVVEYFRA